MNARTRIACAEELPSDGMITVRAWDRERRRGWHIEKLVHADPDWETATVLATPVDIGTGTVTGERRRVTLRFSLDTVETMP